MNEELVYKIEHIIHEHASPWGDDLDTEKAAAEIAALLEAERKPDTITIPEAIERLVEYFENMEIKVEENPFYESACTFTIKGSYHWKNAPDFIRKIFSGGNSTAAIKAGLGSMFTAIINGEINNESEDEDDY